jgi:hypothetical protein
MSPEQVERAVEDLLAENLIRVTTHENPFVPGRRSRTVTLSDNAAYPIDDTIAIGERRYPRMIAGDTVGGEDLNGFIEVMGEVEEEGRKRIEQATERLMRRYWVNTAGLLGLFVAVFALILRASEPVMAGGLSAKDMFMLKSAEVGPLAIVLLLFVVALYLVSRSA